MTDARIPGAAAWPATVDPADPFLGELDGVDGPLAAALRAGAGDDEIEALAAEAGLGAPLAVEPAPPPAPGAVPTDADLVRVGTDHEPALVPRATELLLGRWPDDWPRAVRIAAVAWGALLPGDDGTVPAARWARRDAPAALRAGARALIRTPPAVWRVQRRPDGVILHEIGGWLDVRTVAVAALPADRPIGEVLVARLVATERGAHVATAIGAPGAPDPAAVQRWLRRIALAERARGSAAPTAAEALRLGGHHLARWLLTGHPGAGERRTSGRETS